MKKLFILPILGILLFGCSKKELIQVNGIVHGYVTDLSTGAYLDAVTVSYRQGSDSGSVVTDASGYYSISGLEAGYIPMTFEKSGYASYQATAWIEPLYDYRAVRGGGEVPYYEEENIELPILGSTITGVLMKEVGPYSDVRPAANYRVVLSNSEYYLPSQMETTTNQRGEFSFTDLPCDREMYIYYEPSADDDNYYSRSSDWVYTPMMGTIEIRYTLSREDLGIFFVSANVWNDNGTFVDNFPVNGSIVLNFNQPVSAELTKTYGFIALTAVAIDLDADVEFSGSTVTITPPVDLANDQSYTLSFSVMSETLGDMCSRTIGFHTVE
jgi:hypothetical protein